MTKICDFPYPIYDLIKNFIPYFDLTLRLLGEGLLLLALSNLHSRHLNRVEEGKGEMAEGGQIED